MNRFGESETIGYQIECIPRRRGQHPPERLGRVAKYVLNRAKPPQVYDLPQASDPCTEHAREQVIEIMEKASNDVGYYDRKVSTEKLLLFIFG